MTTLIQAKSLSLAYGNKTVIEPFDWDVKPGQIIGLLGPNGAGKTTLIRCLCGLLPNHGKVEVLGKDPRQHRSQLMKDITTITDVATLPRWMTANKAIEFLSAVHPNFCEKRARKFLKRTTLTMNDKIKTYSKGMVTQLHLALTMAIDAKLLILDEPTLGLDIAYQHLFFQQLIEDYYDSDRSIIVATHQIEAIEPLLTHLLLLGKKQVYFNDTMDQFKHDFFIAEVDSNQATALRALTPLSEQALLGKTRFLFTEEQREKLKNIPCETHPASIRDVFIGYNTGDQT